MKILILSFYYKPDLSAGSFRTTALVNAMLEQLSGEDRIDVMTTFPNRYSSFTTEAIDFEVNPRLTINRIELTAHSSGMLDQSKAFIDYATGVLRITKNRNYDLIFATSSRLMTAVLGAYISKRMKTCLYLDIRDIFVDTIKDVLSKKIACWLKIIFSCLESWAIHEAVKVNLVSHGFMPYFRKKYPNKSLIFFTNGIDQEFFEAQPKECIQHNSRLLSVVYAGNIGEGQGLHNIIPELARRFAGRLQFKIIGDGGRKQKLVSAIAAAGVNNVDILPPVKRADLIQIYQSADILFLHLNDHDAFRKVLPSKVFEYGALGKPIWAGVSGYAAEFIKQNLTNSVVFVPCDLEGAVVSFEYLKMITQPRKDFVDKFARVKIMQKMAADIISIAARDAHIQSY